MHSARTLRLLFLLLLVHSVCVSKRSLRDGDFEGACWLPLLGAQRCWFGVRCLPGHARFKTSSAPSSCHQVPPLGLLKVRKDTLAPIEEPRGIAMAAPPCCARPFVLDRAVKEDVCRTSDVVPSCPCTVKYSRRSSRPQPMVSGGDCTF